MTIREVLYQWAGKPDALGAWLDLYFLAQEMGGRIEISQRDLSRRWTRHGYKWSQKRVRLWIQEAIEAGAIVLVEEGPRGVGIYEVKTTPSQSRPGSAKAWGRRFPPPTKDLSEDFG